MPSTYSLDRVVLRFHAFGEERLDRRVRHTIYAARLLRPWGEGEATHRDGEEAAQGDVTYDSARHGLERWESPGAPGVTDVADAESSATVGENWPEWVTFDVTESVRYFLANPDKNYGWKIAQDPDCGVDDSTIEYAAGAYIYRSSEAPQVHLRPMLILTSSDRTAETTDTIPQ